MYLTREFKLLDNALDSLRVGIDFYLNETLETAHKHSILNVFHAIELLLKEKVRRSSPLLIYKNTTKKIDQDSMTVGFDEVLIILDNLGITLSKEDKQHLMDLKGKRNDIVHFEYHQSDTDADTLGVALKFIKTFLEIHLNVNLKDIISPEIYSNIEEIVDAFEERYDRAINEAQDIVRAKTKDDLADMRTLAMCPECSTETLPCVGESTVTCTLCKGEFEVESCDYCGNYSADLDSDYGMCESCVEALEDRIERE